MLLAMSREKAQAAWEKIVRTGFTNYNQLSPDQKIWFNIEPLTTEGIIDHYLNHGAEHNQDTLAALKALGFPDIAKQMHSINTLFRDGKPPEDIDERNEEWNSWCDEHEEFLNEIDDKFWIKCADVEKALMDHIDRTGIGID
ncbi:DUF4375 domain-containing protein [Rudanella paleaurantiibacter]|uniref:DUF4375 domain-containing protein n=1 Tax=Rudanella paleaurantiibacter TaxID=2614655 RepID=A0A7J5U0L0_9BACT|nr:DUF4375 domain-containing protein [Rudanella paleaurantiibacter]KAB7731288.1 DUF4375 domain-containing protein [Rudanella paleaurantiibacter]